MKEEAEKIKGEANEVFKQKHYERAIELYTAAIAIAPEEPVLFSNRSIAHLKNESVGTALQDANKGYAYISFDVICFECRWIVENSGLELKNPKIRITQS